MPWREIILSLFSYAVGFFSARWLLRGKIRSHLLALRQIEELQRKRTDLMKVIRGEVQSLEEIFRKDPE